MTYGKRKIPQEVKNVPKNNKVYSQVLHVENLLQQSIYRALQLIIKVLKEQNALTHRHWHLNGIILLCSRQKYKWVTYTLIRCIVAHDK
jgi:hypothetical protein